MPQTLAAANWFEYVRVSISLLTLASIFIAYQSYRANVAKQDEDRARDRDKEMLAQAQKSMQWAYDVLTDEGRTAPPAADRLNWLTAARHLLRAGKLAEQISSATYRTVYEEIEEFWRHRFYVALSHKILQNWTYYADESSSHWPENIEINSALVVVNFSNWKTASADPMDEVDRGQLISADGTLTKGGAGRGLKAYLSRLEEIRAARQGKDVLET